MSDPTASPSALDLSRLPAPTVVEALSFDAIRDALIADLRTRLPGFDATVASDPVIKLLEVAAYRELLARAAINDAARGTMLAFAVGTDLDNLAAFYGLQRLVVAAATEIAPAVLESDDELRARVQLAPELLGIGMTAGGYRARALTVAPSVRDVAVLKRAGGRVDVVLLGRAGDGIVAPAVVEAVYKALLAEDGAQLTDVISVRSARIVPYAVALTIRVRTGPDPMVVRAAAEAAVRAYAAARHRIGFPVYAQMLEAAASVGGVELVTSTIADVDPGEDGAPYLTAVTIAGEVFA